MISTPQELVQCVLWLAELQSFMAVQRHFRTQYGRHPPTRKNFWFWDNKLKTTGSLLCVKSPGKTLISEENVNLIRETFQRSPHKSIYAANLQLQIPRSHTNFAVDMLKRIDASPNFLGQVCFLDKATFHVSGAVKATTAGFVTAVKIQMSHVSWREAAPK
jgi:hypothetical protein